MERQGSENLDEDHEDHNSVSGSGTAFLVILGSQLGAAVEISTTLGTRLAKATVVPCPRPILHPGQAV